MGKVRIPAVIFFYQLRVSGPRTVLRQNFPKFQKRKTNESDIFEKFSKKENLAEKSE